MTEYIYEDLSYKIIGACYDVFNYHGYGLREKAYYIALQDKFEDRGLTFKLQLYAPIQLEKKKIPQYLDFLIDDKIIVELKVGKVIRQKYFDQIKSYLKTNNVKLGLLVLFSPIGVKVHRIVNIY